MPEPQADAGGHQAVSAALKRLGTTNPVLTAELFVDALCESFDRESLGRDQAG